MWTTVMIIQFRHWSTRALTQQRPSTYVRQTCAARTEICAFTFTSVNWRWSISGLERSIIVYKLPTWSATGPFAPAPRHQLRLPVSGVDFVLGPTMDYHVSCWSSLVVEELSKTLKHFLGLVE